MYIYIYMYVCVCVHGGCSKFLLPENCQPTLGNLAGITGSFLGPPKRFPPKSFLSIMLQFMVFNLSVTCAELARYRSQATQGFSTNPPTKLQNVRLGTPLYT